MESEHFVLRAVTANARQLYLLLRCINFAPFAQVQITQDGLRFSVEEAGVMEGFAFLEHTLFTSYKYNPPPPSTLPSQSTRPDHNEDDAFPDHDPPPFEISLPALLETLQILGLTDPRSARDSSRDPSTNTNTHNSTFPARTAFSTHLLGLPSTGLCRLVYSTPGAPLRIHISEPGISTTCELTTYEPGSRSALAVSGGDASTGEEGGGRGAGTATIPFARDRLALKIILRSAYLHDALTELASTNPERLVLRARRERGTRAPLWVLEAEGPLGSASVEFGTPAESRAASSPRAAGASFAGGTAAGGGGGGGGGGGTAAQDVQQPLLETFQVAKGAGCRQAYKFSLIRNAVRAMQLATKVSVRIDQQGVLSLQFMIEVESASGVEGNRGAGPAVSFVDFRFVPFISDGEEDASDGEGEEDAETESE
ncbi:hypothetical protein EV356DRAFT_513311 [Viridothelium virens]|uniref:Rad1-domain-containing protein n=1 Tax=Viridothelium virens TaxID=1048519 RepID=A0A6A6HDJ0_VIRVR|nr:hypothetical protein EV356DRAFT_513311 [Viridothelium virens]